ncbi:hypothetical protein NHL50_11510 [Acidimicrobiia bacterium EGI L10123]|uniref:hypothetical protein n=1 Tax=Salinilacustrithrix flava TaxID=2957203 RepID=UPI003D7C2105|nr:hypothetical protein [Acidimicrobiia bacterium EGI L10123]
MRRALAAALLGISLWIGSLAWSGFLLTRTVLDPDRSERVAEALYEDEAVRARLAANVADGVQASLPEGFPVDDATVEAGAAQALESPAVEAVFVDAFVRTHQAMLGEGDVPRTVDPGAFGSAGRDALVAARPELDGVLPAAPQVAVSLPTERVPNLGPVRRGLLTAVPILAGVAAVGALLALVITSNRPAVIRRAGIWAVMLSALVLAVAYGIPALAGRVAPDQSEVIAALVGAMVAETRLPAIALGALGAAGIVLSLFWRAAPALLAEPAPPQRRPRREPRLVGGPPPRRDISRPASRPAPAVPPRRPDASPTTVQPRPQGRRHPELDADPTQVGASPSRPGPGDGGNADLTTQQDVPSPPAGPTRWVAGVGWVVESAEHIPPEARWVPGVGYVIEEG